MNFPVSENSISIAIFSEEPSLFEKSVFYSNLLNIPMVENKNNLPDIFLTMTREGLKASHKNFPKKFLWLNFLAPTYMQRCERAMHQKKEALATAVGISTKNNMTVVDATTGLGRDGVLLSMLGASVIFLERSPVLWALLHDAFYRLFIAKNDEKMNLQKKLVLIDAKKYLTELARENFPDVIYIDPMHPSRKKSAMVKEEMRMVRAIVGDDLDSRELFILALSKAKKRVVVKMPKLAKPMSDKNILFQKIENTIRYDVYQI